MTQVFVDSNVVVYALNTRSPKSGSAQLFLNIKQTEACISHQVINESLRVLTHPKFSSPFKIDAALQAVWKIAEAVNLVSPTDETAFIHRLLVSKYQCSSDKIFDAYLVATALSHGISLIATDNVKDFKRFEEITIVNPFL